MSDVIYRQAAIDALICKMRPHNNGDGTMTICVMSEELVRETLNDLPSVEPERLNDDDFETIRIHLNAYKEKLCNQRRWKEAEEYQRIIDRFMAFASTQPERKKGKWIDDKCSACGYKCSACGYRVEPWNNTPYCPSCGAYMRGEKE